jgi:alpha-methylacyl-CoA racemase
VAEKTLAQWTEIFKKLDACVEPVLTLAEACESEHVKQRDLVVEVKTYENSTQKQVGSAIKFSGSQPNYGLCGAPLGFHNEEVLAHIGMSRSDIKKIKDSGILG